MCRCACGRACAGEEREIATYVRLVRPANWVGDRLASRLRSKKRIRRAPMSENASSAHDVMALPLRLREVQSVAHDPVRVSGAPSSSPENTQPPQVRDHGRAARTGVGATAAAATRASAGVGFGPRRHAAPTRQALAT